MSVVKLLLKARQDWLDRNAGPGWGMSKAKLLPRRAESSASNTTYDQKNCSSHAHLTLKEILSRSPSGLLSMTNSSSFCSARNEDSSCSNQRPVAFGSYVAEEPRQQLL
jgi:hypothetical protein